MSQPPFPFGASPNERWSPYPDGRIELDPSAPDYLAQLARQARRTAVTSGTYQVRDAQPCKP